MCQVKPGKVDYARYRYWLLHDPNCTKTAMQHINERDPFPVFIFVSFLLLGS